MGGWNVLDYSGYPDCRAEFLGAMSLALDKGLFKGPYKIHYPLIDKTKADIIKWGIELGARYDYALSCYMGHEVPCGRCDSCILRAKGWNEIGDQDHLINRLKIEGKM
jgi:7-cyano-7-deazaguanine synthase